MILKLRGVGNPDLQQFADVAEPRTLEVGSFAEASIKTREYIREWNLGGGNLTADIFDKRRDGRQIAFASYNGRVWKVPMKSCCMRRQRKKRVSNRVVQRVSELRN